MLWGALNNATQAMMAMSWDMGSISQNIANVNTVGYKRKESLFKTLLSESKGAAGGGGLDVFTVKATDRFHLQAQGVLTPTNHWADLAINGRGFFMVSPTSTTGQVPTSASTDDPNAVLYTRAGTFLEKAGAAGESYLVTSEGYHLMGWQYDAASGALGSSLTPVYTTPEVTMDGNATTEAQILANLPAGVAVGPSGASNTVPILHVAAGTNKDVTFDVTRSGPTTWNVTNISATGLVATSPAAFSFEMDVWGNVTTVPNNTAIQFDWGAGLEAAQTVSYGGLAPSSMGELTKINLPVFDAAFGEHNLSLGFERISSNNWYMHLEDGTSVALEFDGDGQMVTAQPISINASFTSGTPPVTTTQAIQVDLTSLTQFDGPLYLGEVEQDGYGTGRMQSSNFTSEGDLVAYFSNGESRKLFKVPVATFRSENNLEPVAGTLYRRSVAAGDIAINSVDDAAGGGGSMGTYAVENSTVDIGEEFTRMIMTQKAYSSNATVFKTADEMTTTARDLKG